MFCTFYGVHILSFNWPSVVLGKLFVEKFIVIVQPFPPKPDDTSASLGKTKHI